MTLSALNVSGEGFLTLMKEVLRRPSGDPRQADPRQATGPGQHAHTLARSVGDAPTCGVANVPGYRAVQVKTNDDDALPLPTNPKLVDPPAGTDAL